MYIAVNKQFVRQISDIVCEYMVVVDRCIVNIYPQTWWVIAC